MRRFFIAPQDISDKSVFITGPEARHMHVVLRLKPNTQIELFDGKGNIHTATITEIQKKSVTAIITSTKTITENPPHVQLAQALLKGKKMDLVIQKATELGITEFFPMVSQYCTNRRQTGSQLARWNKIAHESCKQCGRPTPLKIHACTNFSVLMKHHDLPKYKIILWEEENSQEIGTVLPRNCLNENILIVVGSEGGFSIEEIELAQQHGFQSSRMGRNILRAETASIAACSIIQYLLGNLGTQ